MTFEDIMGRLGELGNETDRAGMARFGINVARAYGVSVARLREMAGRTGRDPALAARLWDSGAHEARILACLIDDPRGLSRERARAWVLEFDSWDLCDACCGNLFDKAPFAAELALEFAARDEEFVRRAGFSLMAALAVHDKLLPDGAFDPFLAAIERTAGDPRNFVKKAVNWALRQIGKRNMALRDKALEVAERLAEEGGQAARWVGLGAIRELKDEKIVGRIRAKTGREKPGA
jgi:3-methyladenine DNA glycosylase AlkD